MLPHQTKHTDEQLEEDIYKFVNNLESFQSPHYRKLVPKSQIEQDLSDRLEKLPTNFLLHFAFRLNKYRIHKSFQKKYFQHLRGLTREEIIDIILHANETRSQMDLHNIRSGKP